MVEQMMVCMIRNKMSVGSQIGFLALNRLPHGVGKSAHNHLLGYYRIFNICWDTIGF